MRARSGCGSAAGSAALSSSSTWIAPWIRKIVIDYKQAPSRPSFAAFFTGWDAEPEAGDALFSFVAPSGAEKIQTVALPRRGKQSETEMQGEAE